MYLQEADRYSALLAEAATGKKICSPHAPLKSLAGLPQPLALGAAGNIFLCLIVTLLRYRRYLSHCSADRFSCMTLATLRAHIRGSFSRLTIAPCNRCKASARLPGCAAPLSDRQSCTALIHRLSICRPCTPEKLAAALGCTSSEAAAAHRGLTPNNRAHHIRTALAPPTRKTRASYQPCFFLQYHLLYIQSCINCKPQRTSCQT